MRVWRSLPCAVAAMAALAVGAAAPSNPALREELIAMMAADQAALKAEAVDNEKFAGIVLRNRNRLKEIVRLHGWPTLSLVGADGSQAAWIVAQHADVDREFQREVLALMKPLAGRGEVEPKWYAYLHDRLNEPQRYGTQGACREKGVWAPRDIEDPAFVDARRATVGLGKLSDYVTFASSNLCKR